MTLNELKTDSIITSKAVNRHLAAFVKIRETKTNFVESNLLVWMYLKAMKPAAHFLKTFVTTPYYNIIKIGPGILGHRLHLMPMLKTRIFKEIPK
jgi:hypothetical protein